MTSQRYDITSPKQRSPNIIENDITNKINPTTDSHEDLCSIVQDPLSQSPPLISSRVEYEQIVSSGANIGEEASLKYLKKMFNVTSTNQTTLQMAQLRLQLMQDLADQEDLIQDMERRASEDNLGGGHTLNIGGASNLGSSATSSNVGLGPGGGGSILRAWESLLSSRRPLETLPKHVRKFYVDINKHREEPFSFTSVSSQTYTTQSAALQHILNRLPFQGQSYFQEESDTLTRISNTMAVTDNPSVIRTTNSFTTTVTPQTLTELPPPLVPSEDKKLSSASQPNTATRRLTSSSSPTRKSHPATPNTSSSFPQSQNLSAPEIISLGTTNTPSSIEKEEASIITGATHQQQPLLRKRFRSSTQHGASATLSSSSLKRTSHHNNHMANIKSAVKFAVEDTNVDNEISANFIEQEKQNSTVEPEQYEALEPSRTVNNITELSSAKNRMDQNVQSQTTKDKKSSGVYIKAEDNNTDIPSTNNLKALAMSQASNCLEINQDSTTLKVKHSATEQKGNFLVETAAYGNLQETPAVDPSLSPRLSSLSSPPAKQGEPSMPTPVTYSSANFKRSGRRNIPQTSSRTTTGIISNTANATGLTGNESVDSHMASYSDKGTSQPLNNTEQQQTLSTTSLQSLKKTNISNIDLRRTSNSTTEVTTSQEQKTIKCFSESPVTAPSPSPSLNAPTAAVENSSQNSISAEELQQESPNVPTATTAVSKPGRASGGRVKRRSTANTTPATRRTNRSSRPTNTENITSVTTET